MLSLYLHIAIILLIVYILKYCFDRNYYYSTCCFVWKRKLVNCGIRRRYTNGLTKYVCLQSILKCLVLCRIYVHYIFLLRGSLVVTILRF
jgi:hypothetical protein